LPLGGGVRLAEVQAVKSAMKRTSSETIVRALLLAGFRVYRRDADATILERGLRAVTVRTRAEVPADVLMDLRRMAGLSWQDLDCALAAAMVSEVNRLPLDALVQRAKSVA
jgi:hypothetical protein